jgi:hypothetical protein
MDEEDYKQLDLQHRHKVRKSDKSAELLAEKHILVEYLKSKLSVGDWHGVQDAASDIREIDAKLSVWELI